MLIPSTEKLTAMSVSPPELEPGVRVMVTASTTLAKAYTISVPDPSFKPIFVIQYEHLFRYLHQIAPFPDAAYNLIFLVNSLQLYM